MKKILFIALLTAGTASFATAQTATPAPKTQDARPVKTPEQRATDISNHMTKQLGLTADQKTKIHDLALTKAQKMDALKAKGGEDNTANREERKKIMAEFDAGVKAILTPDQYAKWQAEKEERKEKKEAPAPQAK